MSSHQSDPVFSSEKENVLGELAVRMKKCSVEGYKNRRDDADHDDFPPPPPVFQTYAAQLSGRQEQEDEEELPPPPPCLLPSSSSGSLSSQRPGPPTPLKSSLHSSPKPYKPPSFLSSPPDTDKPSPLPPPKPWLTSSSTGVTPRSVSSSSFSSSSSPDNVRMDPSPGRRQSSSGGDRKESAGGGESPWAVSSAHARTGLNSDKKVSMEGTEVMAMMNTPTKNCFACSQCVDASDGCTAMGRSYHQACFCCASCNRRLESKFFTSEDRPLCGECYKEPDETCSICQEPISGDCLVSGDKHYHHHCMKCATCGDPLRGTYFTYMDKLICEKDYKDTQKTCSECGVTISGVYYTLDNEKIVCEADYKSQLGNCQKCGLVVEGRIMKVSGSLFHPDCFTCTVCQKSMVGVPFSLDDDKKIYCAEDYQRKHASICSACSQPILPRAGETSAPRLRAMGRDFHPACFKCQDCSLVLDSRIPGCECYPLGDTPLCGDCNRKRQS